MVFCCCVMYPHTPYLNYIRYLDLHVKSVWFYSSHFLKLISQQKVMVSLEPIPGNTGYNQEGMSITHIYTLWGNTKLHVFGLWEDTGVLGGNPAKMRENMQTPQLLG